MCTFIAEYEILTYNKQKSNACKLQFFFKITCKKDDFPKARSRMLMKLFKIKIQTMGFEMIDLCSIYFQDDRSKQYQNYEQSNWVKELILREEEEERNAGSLEDPQWRFKAEC